jgi:hypothetical protein
MQRGQPDDTVHPLMPYPARLSEPPSCFTYKHDVLYLHSAVIHMVCADKLPCLQEAEGDAANAADAAKEKAAEAEKKPDAATPKQ